jgi:hypothetical protein
MTYRCYYVVQVSKGAPSPIFGPTERHMAMIGGMLVDKKIRKRQAEEVARLVFSCRPWEWIQLEAARTDRERREVVELSNAKAKKDQDFEDFMNKLLGCSIGEAP